MLIDRRFLLRARRARRSPHAAFLPARAKGARDITVKDVNGLAVFAGAGCNVVALPGPEGALLVDGGRAINSSRCCSRPCTAP